MILYYHYSYIIKSQYHIAGKEKSTALYSNAFTYNTYSLLCFIHCELLQILLKLIAVHKRQLPDLIYRLCFMRHLQKSGKPDAVHLRSFSEVHKPLCSYCRTFYLYLSIPHNQFSFLQSTFIVANFSSSTSSYGKCRHKLHGLLFHLSPDPSDPLICGFILYFKFICDISQTLFS